MKIDLLKPPEGSPTPDVLKDTISWTEEVDSAFCSGQHIADHIQLFPWQDLGRGAEMSLL